MKESISEIIFTTMLGVVWLFGIVLAKAGWLTALAVTFPPYALYLVAEKALKILGWVPV